MLEYNKILVDKPIVIEIANELELVVRKKKARRSILKVLKNILSVESWDSQDKYSAMSDIHQRITFK